MDLYSLLSKDCAWEGIFRVRISKEFRISKIIGNYSVISTNLLSISNVTEDNNLIVELKLNQNSFNENLYIQVKFFFHFSKIYLYIFDLIDKLALHIFSRRAENKMSKFFHKIHKYLRENL